MSAQSHIVGLLFVLLSSNVCVANHSLSSASYLWRLEFGAEVEEFEDPSHSGQTGHFMTAAIEKSDPDAGDDAGRPEISESVEATSAWKMAGFYAAAQHKNSGSSGPTLVTLFVGFAAVVVVCGTIFSRS